MLIRGSRLDGLTTASGRCKLYLDFPFASSDVLLRRDDEILSS